MSFAGFFADEPARVVFEFLTLRDIAGAAACSRELHRRGLDAAQCRLRKAIDETLIRLLKAHANCRLGSSRDASIYILLVSEGLSAVGCNIVELLRAPRRAGKFLEWLSGVATRTPYECSIGCSVSTVFLCDLERQHWTRYHPFESYPAHISTVTVAHRHSEQNRTHGRHAARRDRAVPRDVFDDDPPAG